MFSTACDAISLCMGVALMKDEGLQQQHYCITFPRGL